MTSWQDADRWPAGAGPAPEAGRLSAGAERTTGTPLPALRQHLLRLLRELGFELRTEQLSLLAAVRGSRLAGVTLVPAKVPLELRIVLEPDGTGSRVLAAVVDRWPAKVGRRWGATAAYVEAFGAVLAALDQTLARLDPAAAAGFDPWWRVVDADVAMLRNASSLASRANAAITRQTDRLLDGGPAEQRRAVVRNAGAQTLTFAGPDTVAEVPTAVADAMLLVGSLIANRPGDMPANLVAQVQALVYRVEEELGAGSGGRTMPRLTVTAAEVPVVTFLYQQAQLRGKLPVRMLRICTTCRLEKVVNPDLERIQERSRRTRDLVTGLRAVVAPFVAAGQLVQMNAKAPHFTCPRCQGLDADETVVTYCQRCGDRRTEAALRACPACQFDFRGLLDPAPLWCGTPADPLPPAAGPAPPAVGPAPPAVEPAPHEADASNWPRPPMQIG